MTWPPFPIFGATEMNAIHRLTAKATARRYKILVEMLNGDREYIAEQIRAHRGQFDEAVLAIAMEYDFNRDDMVELYGEYFDALC